MKKLLCEPVQHLAQVHIVCFLNAEKLHCVLVLHSFAAPARQWQNPISPQCGCQEPLVDSQCPRMWSA